MTTGFLSTTRFHKAGSRTLPRDLYLSQAVFDREMDVIFRRRWICAGRSEDVAKPGDFFTVRIAGESLIVTRDQSGAAHAHFNVCRHRGTRLCDAGSGRFTDSIRCPYHGWSYGLDGRLLGAPHMNEVEGFDRAEWPLHGAGLAEWEGFLFVNLAERPEPFETAFAPMIGRLSRYGMPDLRRVQRIEYTVAANWKLVFQNYGECLHCPVLHPLLNTRTPYTSGANDLVEGPFLGGYMALTVAGGSMSVSGERCAPILPGVPPEDGDRVYYYSLLPNLLLSPHPDYVMAHTLWPLSPGSTRIVCEWLFHPGAAADPSYRPNDAIEFWDITNREDWRISELSWAGINSSRYGPGPYSAREAILAAWDREYQRIMASG